MPSLGAVVEIAAARSIPKVGIVHDIWQALPRSTRREALFSLMAGLAPRVTRPEPDGLGSLTVAGFFSASTGLGTGARRLFDGLQDAGLDPGIADLTVPLRQGPSGGSFSVSPGPGTVIVHVNGPMLPWAMYALGRGAVEGKRIIAYWAWELPNLPKDWGRGLRACHRIWTPSTFVAAACTHPLGPPVFTVPYPVLRVRPSGLGRAGFGLPDDAFVALSVFDVSSSLARKNPMGAIAAHMAAFGDSPRHLLVLKVHNTSRAGPLWEEIAQAAAASTNIRVIDRYMPEADLYALMAACDAFISLHRSEGFGFGIAEALVLGKPVVATGWSGNVDFMRGPNAFAVPYRLVPASDPQGAYAFPDMAWAEPELDAAAEILRQVARHPAARRAAPLDFPAPDYRALLGQQQAAIA